ncbi:hypothetical protein BKA61DRAFT_575401 [Leptodontidium sp. MPI-SDFR-AT-0119]|nr:hypothetical protein BKA61DRAFT_575401 [Leptodontidium sp. MPI-SDFR-AT-0119]
MWHLKLTFHGKVQSTKNSAFAKAAKRRKDLENLCLCIDFDLSQLLDDTVTELLLSREYETFCQRLHLKTPLHPEREDPYRVRFPPYDVKSSGVPTRHLLDIKKIQELGMGVYRVHVDNIDHVYNTLPLTTVDETHLEPPSVEGDDSAPMPRHQRAATR